MRGRIILLMAVLAVASVALVPSASAESIRTRTVVKNYELGFVGEVWVVCRDTAPSIGGACFDRHIGERTVTVTIQDDENWPVGAFFLFTDPSGREYGNGFFCESSILQIPAGPTYLYIYLASLGSIRFTSCGLDTRPATSGTITAEFYRPRP